MSEVKQTNLLERINRLKTDMKQASIKANRSENEIMLLAVSKTQSIETIKQAYQLGLNTFGENYLQEALPKIHALDKSINWHFIGHIQSNKTKQIAENFSWVHTIDRLKILKRLALQRPQELEPLNLTLEINLNNEATKSGFKLCDTDLIDQCIDYCKTQTALVLRGLMCMPKRTDNSKDQRRNLSQMHQLLNQLNHRHNLTMDTLSMGTSYDLQSAILEGSTIIRIGQAIFGKRN
ncbi:YggS family pyridoxal phosphate-dependent enzyme [Thiotrichales bacterium 19S3-7]|nr:YggS family pyridoxal phosphate-dependent enzyme [Thiotrichales bacterium 19S3-7]MCF6802132.1 YggS family pyridoxal phosphate-dependent enzyme [Thiotrichales bacterium 19S3-11]